MAQAELFAVAEKFMRELGYAESTASDRMVRAYALAHHRIQADSAALLRRIEEARARGERITPGWLYQQERYRSLLLTMDRELLRFAASAHLEVQGLQEVAITEARANARRLLEEGLDGASFEATLFDVNPANLRQFVGFTGDGSPLRALFMEIAPQAAGEMQGVLLNALAQGWSPAKAARALDRVSGAGLHRSLLIARTEMLRTYRETTRQVYMANAEILRGWVWHSARDTRTCPACLGMHGTEHEVEERLDGHPRCRCAMVPALIGTPVTWETGEEWLRRQPDAVALTILGPMKHALYADGRVTLADMVARTESPRWGSMRHERSVRSILASLPK